MDTVVISWAFGGGDLRRVLRVHPRHDATGEEVTAEEERDPFPKYAGMAAGVGVAGFLGAYLLPRVPEERLSALIGVAGSALAGVVALVLKKRAMVKGLSYALG